MKKYEYIRENGWRLFYKDDPSFSYDDQPTAKVISFFQKKKNKNYTNKHNTPKSVDYSIVKSIDWIEENLNRTIKYKKKWNEYNVYLLSTLQGYVEQCKEGGYKKAILSKQEYAIICPKETKKEKLKNSLWSC